MDDESLGDIETQLINKYVPVLNLKHNRRNPYRAEISTLRKRCREIAKMGDRGGMGPSKNLETAQQEDCLSVSKKSPGTLHEAMKVVLSEMPNLAASTRILSDKIYNRNLYRKKDGGKALPGQIFLRARKYPALFEIIDRGKIRLHK